MSRNRTPKWIQAVGNFITAHYKKLLSAVATAVLALLIYFFGLDPDSSNIVPIFYGRPWRIYEPHFFSMDFPMWHVKDTVELERVITSKGAKSPFYLDYFQDGTVINTNGSLSFLFDLENIATRSQINLSEIYFEIEYEDIPIDTTEIFTDMFPFDWAEVREFNATIDIDTSPSAPNIQIATAIPSSGNISEFISLSPNERETIRVNTQLLKTGFYHITPVAKIKYRDKQYEYRFPVLDVMFTRNYHEWKMNFLSTDKFELISKPYKVIRSENSISLDGLIQNPSPYKLSFDSNLLYNCYVFTIKDREAIAQTNEECNSDINNYYPDSDIIEINGADMKIITKTLTPHTGGRALDIVKSPSGRFLAVIVVNKSLSPGEADIWLIDLLGESSQKIMTRKNISECHSTVWASKKEEFVFICTYDGGNELWKATTTNEYFLLNSSNSYMFFHPKWSPDDKYIAIGGDGLWLIPSGVNLPVLELFTINFDCYRCVRNLKFNN